MLFSSIFSYRYAETKFLFALFGYVLHLHKCREIYAKTFSKLIMEFGGGNARIYGNIFNKHTDIYSVFCKALDIS